VTRGAQGRKSRGEGGEESAVTRGAQGRKSRGEGERRAL